MKRQVKVAIVGNGERATCYCKYALTHPDELKVTAIVDTNPDKLEEGANTYGVGKEFLFSSVDEFLAYEEKHGKLADGIVNATMDEWHYKTAMPLLRTGHHMLLEKPIVNNEEQLLEIQRVAKENGCLLMVCHVLRYTPFFKAIKEQLLTGVIGEIMHIETCENVGIAHASNSYIRGKWNSTEKCGSSMLLAKCCHDIDLLCWLNNTTYPLRVSSFGGRNFLTEDKAPEGAGTRCLNDCPHVDTCQYSAKSIYVLTDNFPYYSWTSIRNDYKSITKEEKINSLKTTNPHGECAYKVKSDLVDHQAVMLQFNNGSTATHSMIQGSVKPCRLIRIMGTKGEIQGSIESSKFVVRTYDFDNADYLEEKFDVSNMFEKDDHHAGGDEGIIKDYISMLAGEEPSISCTKIDDSIYGHLSVFGADKSLFTGKVENINIK